MEHVDYLWEDSEAPEDEVDSLVYRSNLLGQDLRITNYAGGNTSVKRSETDPITGEQVDVLWVKASGGDLGTITRDRLAAVRLDRTLQLESNYGGLDDEDRMVELLGHAVWAMNPNAPSIDTFLHAFLPYKHIDHTHPDALIAVAASKDGKGLSAEIFGSEIGWVDWQRPGFDLAIKLRDLIQKAPALKGIVLGGHGLITWAETSKACYQNTLQTIERSAAFIESKRKGSAFGGPLVTVAEPESRIHQQARIMPLLRGLTSSATRTIGHVRDDESVLEFICGNEAGRLSALGTSCPDHFLRTKRLPLLLDIAPDADPLESQTAIKESFERYRKSEKEYYDRNAVSSSPAFRSPNPVIVLWPGVGLFSFGKDKPTARISAEFFANAINVMRGAETISSYTGLSEPEAFRIEYWQLEEAKLKRMPPEKPLSRRVAFVTGAAGGIGEAIVRRLAADGASVIAADMDIEGCRKLTDELGETAQSVEIDVTAEASVANAFEEAARTFGGVDIVVNNAGVTSAAPLTETGASDYERVHKVVDFGSFLVTREAARQMKVQGLTGDIVYIVSKNALAVGSENIAYSSAMAAQLHQMRLAAVELGELGVRVNAINPDAVMRGSKMFEGDWGRERAAKYGVPVSELGKFYASRTLLGLEILPEDIASAVAALVEGDLPKTSGAVIPVDGGLPAAFPR